MSYAIFAKYAAEAMNSGLGKALAVAGAVPASVENAARLQDLYQDPETTQFAPERASEALASTLTTMPGISESLDQAANDPRITNYFMMLKNNPNVRLTLMGTHSLMPVAAELEDRINRKTFEQQRQGVLQQLEQSGASMRGRADEAAEQAAAIEEYRDEYNRLARIAGNKADPEEITRRVATSRGRGTHQRVAYAEQMAKETMAKPGLHIVHKNLNLAKRRELDRKIKEQVEQRRGIAEANYGAFGQVGQMHQQVVGMPGPEKINKAPRLNIQNLKKNLAANLAAQENAKQAAGNHNVFDLLLPVDKENIGRHKRTVLYIRRHNDEEGGIKQFIRDRVRDRFDAQFQYPLLNNKKNEDEGAPITTLLKDLQNL